MAAGKELRTKIKSVENTKKITKAMEMISTDLILVRSSLPAAMTGS